MAFLINGVEVVTNERSLDDVNLAGITTALLVGPEGAETMKVDGVSGIVTAAGLNIGGADGATAIDAIGFSSALADDAASKTRLVAEGYIKEYVDAQIAETGGSLSFSAVGGTDSSGNGTLDISDNTLTITGTGNQINFTADDGTDTFTAALSATVQLPGSLAFGPSGQAVNTVVTAAAGISANNNETSIPTTAAVAAAIVESAGGGSAAAATINLEEDFTTATELAIPFADVSGGDGQKSLKYADESGTSKLTFIPAQGRLNAQEFNSLSDIRFKENIELIEAPLEKIEALRGVTYDWKNNGNASAGIIAQEVKAVMPELISETEERMTVNYNGLTGLLIEAVKAQSTRIAALEAKLG